MLFMSNEFDLHLTFDLDNMAKNVISLKTLSIKLLYDSDVVSLISAFKLYFWMGSTVKKETNKQTNKQTKNSVDMLGADMFICHVKVILGQRSQ